MPKRRFDKNVSYSDRQAIIKQRDIVQHLVSKYQFKCPCGKKLNPYQVQNMGSNIYHHCIYCGYDFNYRSILEEVDRMRNNNHNVV